MDSTTKASDNFRPTIGQRGTGGGIRWLVPLLVSLVTFVVFLPSLQNGFVWDDQRAFLDNPFYRGLGWRELRWMWTTFYLGSYRPVTWTTYGADYVLWGLWPGGYHLTSLLL